MDKIESLNGLFGAAVSVRDGKVTVSQDAAIASDAMDKLVRAAVFGEADEKEHARWLIWEIGQAVGVRSASIEDLYMARGRARLHRAGDQRARHGVRYRPLDLPRCQREEGRRVHPRDRAFRDCVYRPASRRICVGDP